MGGIVSAFHVFRDALYMVLKFYQHLVQPVLGSQSYWFAIVMLTISVRTLLIPLTVKQVRASRAMSDMAPEIKKLQAKYKNDRERLNQEMMALYKERGANPLAGCLPLVAQAPFFFALYHVIFQPRIAGEVNILHDASFFGVPLQTHWLTLQGWDKVFSLAGIVILVLILAMSATTYISQRQLMARQAEVNPQQAMLMKFMPLMFLVFSVNFPLAVIIYWVTTNLWSMGQQYLLLRNRPPVGAAASASDDSTPTSRSGGGSKSRSGQNGAKPIAAGGGSKSSGGGILGTLRSAFNTAQNMAEERTTERSKRASGNGSGATKQTQGRNDGQGSSARSSERTRDARTGRPKASSNGNPPGGGASTAKRGSAARSSERANDARSSERANDARSSERANDARAGTGAGADGETAEVTKGSTAGRKPASPPRSGGGKSGRSNQQRRRKR